MSDWIHELPLPLMAIVVFGGTWLTAAVIHLVVQRSATGERARAFKGISPGMLSPLGITFGLLVVFVAAQVWGDVDRANAAVNREAGALRAVVLLSEAFPGEPASRLRMLVRQHITEAETVEWPAMATGRVTLAMIPASLADALRAAVALPGGGPGQVAAQKEIISALEEAMDARRQRVLVSRTQVNGVKWAGLILQALCTLTAIAMVHSDNRRSAVPALGLFATAAAVCILLILTHDRPFTGQVSVKPTSLLQVQPGAGSDDRPQ
jgi:hypothetical protein